MEENKLQFQEGFYWVKKNKNSEWEPAKYNSERQSFNLIGLTGWWKPEELFDVNDTVEFWNPK